MVIFAMILYTAWQLPRYKTDRGVRTRKTPLVSPTLVYIYWEYLREEWPCYNIARDWYFLSLSIQCYHNKYLKKWSKELIGVVAPFSFRVKGHRFIQKLLLKSCCQQLYWNLIIKLNEVIMEVADALVPNGHQGISNSHDDHKHPTWSLSMSPYPITLVSSGDKSLEHCPISCKLGKNHDLLRDHSVYAPSQCEAALQCNTISYWLSICTEWSLPLIPPSHTQLMYRHTGCKQHIIYYK